MTMRTRRKASLAMVLARMLKGRDPEPITRSVVREIVTHRTMPMVDILRICLTSSHAPCGPRMRLAPVAGLMRDPLKARRDR